MNHPLRTLHCECGKVRFEASGPPIVTAVCYCDDCEAGGRLIEALPQAPRVLDADGGASYLVYRDDRFRCVAGGDLLKGYALRDRTPTRRVVATCCNSAMYLKYRPGHWVSTYCNRYDGNDMPSVEMRTNLRYRTVRTAIEDNAPCYRRFPLKLFGKLLAARLAMLMGR